MKDKSINIILDNQHSSGSYISSPTFSNYNYCWLRDGSFIAHAMDQWERFDSSDKYFQWTHRAISRQEKKLKAIIEMTKQNKILLNSDYLPTRFRLNGEEVNDDWPNFQLDGYGVWLWSLHEHVMRTGNLELIERYKGSINIAIEYVVNFWNYPNFDCWQENGEQVHTSTLGCLYGGLKSMELYLDNIDLSVTAEKIKDFIRTNCIINNSLVKNVGSNSIDGSLLWNAVPFKLFCANDLLMKNTVFEIENKLKCNGGVKRYIGDKYYGGGEWIILSCWLGLYYCEVKEIGKAEEILNWVEEHSNKNGELPEQILEDVQDTLSIDKWKSLWGEVASPALWSHAMYLILLKEICNLKYN